MPKISDFYVQYLHAELHQLSHFMKRCYDKNWLPGNSGSFSARNSFNDKLIVINKDNMDKGLVIDDDFLFTAIEEGHEKEIIAWTKSLSLNPNTQPPNDIEIHKFLYRLLPEIQSIMHVHNFNISETVEGYANSLFRLPNHEMLLALKNTESYLDKKYVPVLRNDNSITSIIQKLEKFELAKYEGFIIENHGIYIYSENLKESYKYLESYDALFKIFRYRNHMMLF